MTFCNVHDFILSASALSSPTLDLCRKDIHTLPDPFPGCRKLECVYLEGNKLTSLPDSFFDCCPNLRWLDLRNNSLTALPSRIEKLRSLRTLLLEGNKLTTLPLQLGRLQLTGLNLSRNPLQSPPKHVVECGTKAVLKYLRELLNETIDDGKRGDSSDSEDSDRPRRRRSITPLQPIQQHYGIVTADGRCAQPGADVQLHCLSGGPLPLLKQITLHSQTAETTTARKSQRVPTPIVIMPSQSATPSPDQPIRSKRRARKKHQRGRQGGSRHGNGKPAARSTAEVQEISTALEKQKTEQRLKAWRDEARQLQRAQHLKVQCGNKLGYPRAVDSAPFATEDSSNADTPDELSDAQMRLEAMDVERETLSKLHQNKDSLREARESEVEQRIKQHMLELQDKRQQAGLISSPSDELLQAERKLAEAVVLRKEVEAQRAREYRLTAFTGDLPLGRS